MDIAREAAPEIDRLIFAVAGAIRPRHGATLAEAARRVGLDSIGRLPALRGLLLAGTLSRDVATRRGVYWGQAQEYLDDLVAGGFLTERDRVLHPTETLMTVLDAMTSAVAEEAMRLWSDHDADVDELIVAAGRVAVAASPEHVVAAANHALGEPDDRYVALEHRLTTLRYIRHHDHVSAWQDQELTADEIAVMTALTNGGEVDDTSVGLGGLTARGLADGAKLTEEGTTIRVAIEDETNRLAQRAFDVLSLRNASAFVQALKRLPGEA